jgi:hypothetical protein
MPIKDNRDYMMSINTPHYDIDKDISMEIFMQDTVSCHISVYNDRNDSCVAFQTSRDKLKGLADFIYKTIGEK